VTACSTLRFGLVLETDDKQTIYMHWKGFRHGPKDVIDRLNRGEAVDPSNYYFPHEAILRNRFGKILLAQSHLFDC